MDSFCRNVNFWGQEGLTETLASGGAQFVSLSYDRSEERAADQFAVRTLQELQMDPCGLSSLFTKLKELENTGSMPTLLSTHPSPDERIDYLNEMIDSTNDHSNPFLSDQDWTYLKSVKK